MRELVVSARRELLLAVLAAASMAACGSVSDKPGGADSGPTPPDAAPPDASLADAASADAATPLTPACEAEAACGDAGQVGSLAELLGAIDQCTAWGNAEVDRFRRRTPALQTSAAFALCPEDLDLPPDCDTGEPLCNAAIAITVDPGLTGVDATVACRGAQLAAGVRFRLRYNIDPPVFGNEFRTAHLHFERPCQSECEPGESLCEESSTCLPDFEVCFACGRGTVEECACRTPDNGVLEDCTECDYQQGDVIYPGQCVSGVCEFEPCDTCPCS
jgi:hypothetical protein